MKFTFEDKVQIYNERKRGFTIPQLHLKWKMQKSKIKYIVRKRPCIQGLLTMYFRIIY